MAWQRTRATLPRSKPISPTPSPWAVWAPPTKSPKPSRSSPPTTPASSPASNSSSMAAWPRSNRPLSLTAPLPVKGESDAADEREKVRHATNVANLSLSHATVNQYVDLTFRLEEYESVCGCASPKGAPAGNYHVGSSARCSLL